MARRWPRQLQPSVANCRNAGAWCSPCFIPPEAWRRHGDALTAGASAGGGRRLASTRATHSDLADMVDKAQSFYDSTVEKYAQQPVEILSLKQMLQFGRQTTDSDRVLKSARYVQKEIPKRLARRLLDLQLLPYIVVTNPHIKRVYNNYFRSFETLRRFPLVTSHEENAAFTVLLRQQLDQHAPMLDALAAGLRECRKKQLVGEYLQLDGFFDNMLRSRISRRVIAEQHLHVHDVRPGYVGIISTDLDVADAVDFAAQKAQQVCTETYGQAPDVIISGDKGATMPYVPQHMDYCCFELLKNAMRAVVEFNRQASSTWLARSSSSSSSYTYHKLPAVHVRICAGRSELTLRISDQGGGVPPSIQDKVFSYGFTTINGDHAVVSDPSATDGAFRSSQLGLGASSDQQNSSKVSPSVGTIGLEWGMGNAPNDTNGTFSGRHGGLNPSALNTDTFNSGAGSRFKMAGLGFGLPLSRLYARYFGGELSLHPIPGYGTDAHLTLPRLEEQDWREQTDDVTSALHSAQHHSA